MSKVWPTVLSSFKATSTSPITGAPPVVEDTKVNTAGFRLLKITAPF